MKTGLYAGEGCRNPEKLRLNNMTHHWIRTGLDRLRRTGAALTAAACALGLPGFLTRQTPASAANLVLVYAESVEAQPGDTAQTIETAHRLGRLITVVRPVRRKAA